MAHFADHRRMEIQTQPNTPIRDARKRRNLTQQEVAVELGKKQPTVHKYETGKIPVPGAEAVKLARFLRMSLAAVLQKQSTGDG